MEQIEVWAGDVFQERVRPLEVTPHRRPKKPHAQTVERSNGAPVVDWLSHLADQHKPEPLQDAVEVALAERRQLDDGVVELLRDRLAADVFDETAIRDFLDRHGPFDARDLADPLEFAIEHGGADQHVVVLLRTVCEALGAA